MKEAFEAFIGNTAFENDGNWSWDVWQAAWNACLNNTTTCNMCGNKVVIQKQPDLLDVQKQATT